MDDRFVLVTGAAGGLGQEVVRELTKAGYYVFGCDVAESSIIDDDHYIPIAIDITDMASVDQCFAFISQYTEVLDAIINLAGIFYLDSIVEGSEQKLRNIFEVNFFGTYHINQGSLPFLAVDTSKIINVTSELAMFSPAPFNGYYTLPKVMIDKYNDVLRRELNYLGIRVIKVRIGSFKTAMHEKASEEFDRLLEKTEIYQQQLTKLKHMMDEELKHAKEPHIFAKELLKIVQAKNPKICYNINISRKLKALNRLSEKMQDSIYLKKVK